MRLDAPKFLFRASVCLCFFAYGVVTAYFRVFPFSVLHNAHEAVLAIARTNDDAEFREPADLKDIAEPTVHRYSPACGTELLLVSGGENYLKDQSAGHGCLAWIMDRQGRVKHVWQYDPGLWSQLDGVAVTPGRSARVYPVGLHLYPDGGLLVSFQGWYTFPVGIGLARFDKDSNLIWKKELHTHHWFTVADDGRIYALKSRVVDSPRPVGETRFSLSSGAAKILDDAVVILDADGNVLEEIPLLDALVQSGWQGLLAARAGSDWDSQETCVIMDQDPTHLNGIQLVNAAARRKTPVAAGRRPVALDAEPQRGRHPRSSHAEVQMDVGGDDGHAAQPLVSRRRRAGLRQPRRLDCDRRLAPRADRSGNTRFPSRLSRPGRVVARSFLYGSGRPPRSERRWPSPGDSVQGAKSLGNQPEDRGRAVGVRLRRSRTPPAP